MDISCYESGHVFFACSCDEHEMPQVVEEAKDYCAKNNLSSDVVKIVRMETKEKDKTLYFVLVKKK